MARRKTSKPTKDATTSDAPAAEAEVTATAATEAEAAPKMAMDAEPAAAETPAAPTMEAVEQPAEMPAEPMKAETADETAVNEPVVEETAAPAMARIESDPTETPARNDNDDPLLLQSGRNAVLFLNRFTRFPKLRVSQAASIALAAGFGAVLGSLTAAGVAGLAGGSRSPDPVLALQASVSSLAVEVRALKEASAAADKVAAAEIARLTTRLADNDKAAPELADAIGRVASDIDDTAVSPETTGSIPAVSQPGAAPGWTLWRVRNGRALVRGNGRYFEVVAGSRLPELGVVQKITRENDRWVVTTENGLIVGQPG